MSRLVLLVISVVAGAALAVALSLGVANVVSNANSGPSPVLGQLEKYSGPTK